jgi:hypothetical protein
MKLTALAIVLCAAPALAQPRVTNGELRPAAIGGALTRAAIDGFAAKAATAWLAYGVPILEGDRWICDSMITTRDAIRSGDATGTLALEGATTLYVLFRLEAGQVNRIRIASNDCTLDAGGLTVHWIADVTPTDSTSVLASFLNAAAAKRVSDGALTALAMHRDPAALDRLLTAARDGATTHIRGQALFWLSQRAGDKAVGAITDAIAKDPETDVKKRAVFALSQLPKDEGVPRLIEVARTNPNAAVRKQAMFWLGQTNDPRALKFFEEILFK